MREIKFRAWDGNELVYNSIEVINHAAETFNGIDIQEHKSVTTTYTNSLVREYDQFTGLFDMDGKEIYEGDILEERITILNENNEPEQLEPHLHFMEWYVDDIGSGWTVWPCEVWYSKIIGNKHQNPDLWANRPMAQIEKDRENDILLTNAMKGIKNENL